MQALRIEGGGAGWGHSCMITCKKLVEGNRMMAERTNADTFLFTSESVGEGHAGECTEGAGQ